jgi:23S rRNA (uracil1939-C5)-methyltransferase
VIAIEESEAAVKDAAINTLGLENLEFRQGKSEGVLDSLGADVDVVILDPPRVGCQLEALEAAARWAPRTLCYVSCDPESLARDLDVLVQHGLRVDHVEPVDMFPQTHHVECVATLSSPDPVARPRTPAGVS